MAGNYRGGNGAGAAQRQEFTPEDKANYYLDMADKEQDPLIKGRYVEKAEYWDKVSKGEEITPEMEASCGPNHEWNEVDRLINAKKWLSKSTVDPQKTAKWQFMVDYWTKKAQGQEISAEDQRVFNAYETESDRKMARAAKYHRESASYRKANAMAMAKSLVSGEFPAYGKGLGVVDGKISFVPVSVRSFGNGEAFDGINQFTGQVLAKEVGWKPGPDGHIYLATEKMCGKVLDGKGHSVLNVKQGSPFIYFATVGSAEVVGDKLAKKGQDIDKLGSIEKSEAFQNTEKTYKLYNEADILDKDRTGVSKPMIYRRPMDWHKPSIVIDASDAKTPAEFFGKYNVACRYGATFVTTPEKSKEIRNMITEELSEDIANGRDGKIYRWFNGVRDAYNAEMKANRKAYEDRMALKDAERLSKAALENEQDGMGY